VRQSTTADGKGKLVAGVRNSGQAVPFAPPPSNLSGTSGMESGLKREREGREGFHMRSAHAVAATPCPGFERNQLCLESGFIVL
jgi:hypothetical protein